MNSSRPSLHPTPSYVQGKRLIGLLWHDNNTVTRAPELEDHHAIYRLVPLATAGDFVGSCLPEETTLLAIYTDIVFLSAFLMVQDAGPATLTWIRYACML